MPLKRTLKVTCDSEGCDVEQALHSGTTQPYLAATDAGWTLAEDGERFFCVLHAHKAKPALVPVLDIASYYGSELDADHVAQALRLVIAGLIASEVRTRPTTPDEDWDRDDEEADVVADVYREVAARVANTFGLEVPA